MAVPSQRRSGGLGRRLPRHPHLGRTGVAALLGGARRAVRPAANARRLGHQLGAEPDQRGAGLAVRGRLRLGRQRRGGRHGHQRVAGGFDGLDRRQPRPCPTGPAMARCAPNFQPPRPVAAIQHQRQPGGAHLHGAASLLSGNRPRRLLGGCGAGRQRRAAAVPALHRLRAGRLRPCRRNPCRLRLRQAGPKGVAPSQRLQRRLGRLGRLPVLRLLLVFGRMVDWLGDGAARRAHGGGRLPALAGRPALGLRVGLHAGRHLHRRHPHGGDAQRHVHRHRRLFAVPVAVLPALGQPRRLAVHADFHGRPQPGLGDDVSRP